METLASVAALVATCNKLLAAQNAVLADHGRLLRDIAARLPPGTAAPTAAPPPAKPRADDPPNTWRSGHGASVRIAGAVWAISSAGRVTLNGKPATTPDLTANVVRIGRDAKGRPAHANARGEVRHFDGRPDWPLSAPVVSIVV